ncbi:MAG: uroporphyrinogen decarboxylase family protein [Phycisphaerae bacterium]
MAAARNERPIRLPIYEHLINPEFMEKLLDKRFADLIEGDEADRKQYFDIYCDFYRQMTYDTVSYEVCITEVLPEGGALLGERAGPIQSRADFERYPWDEVPKAFWDHAAPRFQMLSRCLPDGMKAIGGIGNGVFEVSEDLVGFEQLCYMQVDDPELFADLFRKIGGLMLDLWETFLSRFAKDYAICRIGDDMGFKTATLMAPSTFIEHVVPRYRRIARLIRAKGYPFLFHSCGKIFNIMDELIAAGIDAKHSNEDVIAPFDEWIERYGNRIGLFGGIDTDLLCRRQPDALFDLVLERGARFRQNARGYVLGSGNSIPDYVPVEGYLAMIRAAQELRRRELTAAP